MSQPKLRRELGMLEMVAITAGGVIGGWLAEAPYWFEVTGAGSVWIFPLLALLLLPVGFAFAELSAMLPFASAIDVWTSHAISWDFGWFIQWTLYLVHVIEPPLMGFIFSAVASYFLGGASFALVKWMTVAVIVLWFIVSNYRIGITGKLADAMFFIMVTAAVVVAGTFLFSGDWSFENVSLHGGWFPKGVYGFGIGMAILVLKFIGFELAPTLMEEVNYPRRDSWKPIVCAVLIPAALYVVAVIGMMGMAPWSQIAKMDLPEPRLVVQYGLPGFIGIIAIIVGVLHGFTTLMGFWTSSARILYGAAQLNQLPKSFMRLNRHGQPWIANITVLAFSLFFVLATPEQWVQYIYTISCAAAGAIYLVACLDVLILRKKYPDWERPYKVPAPTISMAIGILVSCWIIVGSLMEMPANGYIAMAIYLIVGVVIYGIVKYLQKQDPENWKPVIPRLEDAKSTQHGEQSISISSSLEQ